MGRPGKLSRQLVLELLAGVLQVAEDDPLDSSTRGSPLDGTLPPGPGQHPQHVQRIIPHLLHSHDGGIRLSISVDTMLHLRLDGASAMVR